MSESNPVRVKPVVTLYESYGSGADYIGPRVAEALELAYHEQPFSSDELELEESAREQESLLSRVLAAMGMSMGETGSAMAAAEQDRAALVKENSLTVTQWAEEGGVIVGRSAAFVLAGAAAAIHVRLDGPVEQRVERAAVDAGITLERASRRQRHEDRVRAQMSKEFYGVDPADPLSYDLVLNTGRLDLDTCVDIIVAAVRIRAGLAST